MIGACRSLQFHPKPPGSWQAARKECCFLALTTYNFRHSTGMPMSSHLSQNSFQINPSLSLLAVLAMYNGIRFKPNECLDSRLVRVDYILYPRTFNHYGYRFL